MRIATPRQLPSGKWFVQVRIKGQSISITRDTREECVNEATYIRAAYSTGNMTMPEKSALTIDQIVRAYIESRENKGRSPATIRGYILTHNGHFNTLKSKTYESIKNWQPLIDEELERFSPKTVKNAWGLIAASLKYAKLPVPDVSIENNRPAKDLPFLTKAQLVVFLTVIRDTSIELPALLALHSLRRSEIYGLSRDCINDQNRTIRVCKARVFDKDGGFIVKDQNKTALSTRTIPIFIPRLLELVSDTEDPLVTMHPNTLYNTINRVCARNDLPKIGIQGLRRSFASLCHSKNIPERTTMRWGGWSNPATMHKYYIMLDEIDLQEQAQALMEFTYATLTNANLNTRKRWKLKRLSAV